VKWTRLVCLRIGQVDSSCEFGIEPSGSINCWDNFYHVKTYEVVEV
jgi:hypothetical protein